MSPRSNRSPFVPTLLRRALLGASLLAGLVSTAPAQTAPGSGVRMDSVDSQALKQWLQNNEATPANGVGVNTRLEVEVGNLDPRLHLAPCSRIEPYIPTGTRLWGRSRIGIRCLEGAARWDVSLPVTVKVWGRGWVLNTALAEGTPITAALLSESEIDLAADNQAPIIDPHQWQGQVAARQLAAGQVLRASVLRPVQLFAAGTQVRVVLEGKGFVVTADGQALAPGVQGKPVRIRLENGRILNATPVDERSVTATI
jgi:flagella basal body P-ring formation protein FlgA